MLKINNIIVNENIFFSEEGENIIYAKDYKEEFFNIYNVKFLNESILCESKVSNHISCDIFHNNGIFKNVIFKIIKSNDEKIVINKKTLVEKIPAILSESKKIDVYSEIVSNEAYKKLEEKKIDVYSEIVLDLEKKYRTKKQLIELLKESEKTKKQLSEEVEKTKKQLNEIKNKKEIIVEKKNSNDVLNYKQEILKEFFKVTDKNDHVINERFDLLKEELESRLHTLSLDGLDFFKKENSKAISGIIEEIYKEILENNKKEINLFKNIIKNEASILENNYDLKLKDQIDTYSNINSKLFESVKKAKEDVEIILQEKIKDSNENFLEIFDLSIDKHKKEFSEKFSSKFEKIIKNKEEEIKNKTKKILDEHNESINTLFELKEKEIISASEKLLEESDKKIKELTKKIENINNQLNKSNNEKRKMETLVQDAKKYTDVKMAQVLEESKRFTRVMMDMVGGGSGSVAVQYAAGGIINGDLTVTGTLSSASVDVGNFEFSGGTIDGNLDVTGVISANTILSGGKDITDIFAGEGEGDTNLLDGGLV